MKKPKPVAVEHKRILDQDVTIEIFRYPDGTFWGSYSCVALSIRGGHSAYSKTIDQAVGMTEMKATIAIRNKTGQFDDPA
jgi:hypothetical protein